MNIQNSVHTNKDHYQSYTEVPSVLHEAGLSGSAARREATPGDCDSKLGMYSGLRRPPPSSEALIRSSVAASVYTDVPRVLHEAGFDSGVAWRAATVLYSCDICNACMLMSSHSWSGGDCASIESVFPSEGWTTGWVGFEIGGFA